MPDMGQTINYKEDESVATTAVLQSRMQSRGKMFLAQQRRAQI